MTKNRKTISSVDYFKNNKKYPIKLKFSDGELDVYITKV